MFELLVLTDDFTGALDTGVQFVEAGISTAVITADGFLPKDRPSPQVLVVDLESRHLPPEKAKALVEQAAARWDARYYYKKTDSGMRGNIGAELAGLIRAGRGGRVVFVPAYPKTGRTTVKGIHYANGVPVSKSVFGRDPFEPVRHDYIPDIIAEQCGCIVEVVENPGEIGQSLARAEILVVDAADDAQMRQIADTLREMGSPKLLAGCAGFARYLPDVLDMKAAPQDERIIRTKGVIVLSGSVNRMTLEQVECAKENGFTVVELQPEDKVTKNLASTPQGREILQRIAESYQQTGRVILQSAAMPQDLERTDRLAKQEGLDLEGLRQRIADNLGGLAAQVAASGLDAALAVFGGDTLMAVMSKIGADAIVPVKEISSGVVHSMLLGTGGNMDIITKSGGFGDLDVLVQIEEYVMQHEERKQTCLR